LNKFGKVKVCPHCSEQFKSLINFKVAAILFIPAVVLSLFILKTFFILLGLSGGVSRGIMGGLLVLLSTRFKKLD
jgi:ABC-type phosphate transport system permease subunit